MTMGPRLRVVYFGRADYHAATFLRAIEADHDLVAVVEARARQRQPPGRARSWLDLVRGRGSLLLHARRRGIPYYYVMPRAPGLDEVIARVAPDAGCIASFPQLLPERVFGRFRLGVLNYHPSLLPAYRGPLPLVWQYYHEERRTGVTVHLIDAGEDTGDIIAQQPLAIAFGELIENVEARFAAVGATLMRRALADLAVGAATRTPQRHLRCPFRARSLRAGERLIDWHAWSPERAYHLLRGASPWMEQTPHPDFPLDLVEWRPGALDTGGGDAARAGTIGRRGLRFFVYHPAGRIWLTPRFSPGFAVRALKRRLRANGMKA